MFISSTEHFLYHAMLPKKLVFILFFLFSNSLFAQKLDVLKEKIRNDAIFWADPFSEPFDSLGNWTGTGVKDSLLLLKIWDQKDSLENFVIELLKQKTISLEQKMDLAHLAAYLGCHKALEPIWAELIHTSRIYGWEGPNYDLIDSYLEEVQYPFQQYYWACLSALLKQNPAKNIKKAHYQILEKSLAVFEKKYAQETFLSNDSTFEILAWHYVLMRKVDSMNIFVLKIDSILQKRQIWALVLGSDRSLDQAQFEYTKCLKQNQNLSNRFLSIYKTPIKGKIWYRTVVFCSTETEARKTKESLKKKQPDSFILRLPCYPPRRSYEDWQVYQCEEF